MTVSIEQAQLHLSTLVERSRKGEEIVITSNGESVARLVPAGGACGTSNPWAPYREKLQQAGLRPPDPGKWNDVTVPLIETSGLSASDQLIDERR